MNYSSGLQLDDSLTRRLSVLTNHMSASRPVHPIKVEHVGILSVCLPTRRPWPAVSEPSICSGILSRCSSFGRGEKASKAASARPCQAGFFETPQSGTFRRFKAAELQLKANSYRCIHQDWERKEPQSEIALLLLVVVSAHSLSSRQSGHLVPHVSGVLFLAIHVCVDNRAV